MFDNSALTYEKAFATVPDTAEEVDVNQPLPVRGDAHAFSAGGGRQAILQNTNLEIRPGLRRATQEVSMLNIQQGQQTCPETLVLRQVLDQVPGARLPHWAERENLRPTLRDGVLCLERLDGSLRLVHIPVVFRTGVIQRAHYGPYSAHFGRKKTIGVLRT